MKNVLLLMVSSLVANIAQAIEIPNYTVIKRTDVFEVRQYESYCVAEVVLQESAKDVGNKAFPILAGYIFGKNRTKQSMEMTAPVVQQATSMKMEMTAPVNQLPTSNGFVVQFVMSKRYTLATLPEPTDPRVHLREVPAQTLAVIQYSGTWSQSNYDQHLEKLTNALQKAGIKTRGEPIYSRYNPPFTPWFMRRNEIALQVD